MAQKMRFRKTRRANILFLCLISSAILSGCAKTWRGHLGILDGTLSWSRGDWSRAASAFLESEAFARASDDERLSDYAVFGLASTYLSQDEYDPALSRLASIKASSSAEVRASVWYQAGIIAYRRGEFDEAAHCFRESLKNGSAAIDAKINLELSERALSEEKSRSSPSSSAFSEQAQSDDGSAAIFNLVRKKEQDRWKNATDDASASADAIDY